MNIVYVVTSHLLYLIKVIIVLWKTKKYLFQMFTTRLLALYHLFTTIYVSELLRVLARPL